MLCKKLTVYRFANYFVKRNACQTINLQKYFMTNVFCKSPLLQIEFITNYLS